MDEVLAYLKNRTWEDDIYESRKLYLLKIAKASKDSESATERIGGMLIFNQVIEQLLRESIIGSIGYIKVSIFPLAVHFNPRLDKMTLGQLINAFEQYAIIEPNRELLLNYLAEYRNKRNLIIHKLFTVADFEKQIGEIQAYNELAEEIILLLLMQYNEICECFYSFEETEEYEQLMQQCTSAVESESN